MAVLWLAATFARINKTKWSLKKEKIKQNLNAIAEDFSLKKTVYIQGSSALCQVFFPYKPHTQTFLTCQSKWGREEELLLIIIQLWEVDIQTSSECLVYSFTWPISKSLSLISIQNSASITLITSSRKEVQPYTPRPHTIWEWRIEIKKFDLMCRITRPFIKHNLRFRLQEP